MILIPPKPSPLMTLKCLGSIASTDSTPGADAATKFGSISRDQTVARGALISGAPENSSFMNRLQRCPDATLGAAA